jgi:hypothetical protein
MVNILILSATSQNWEEPPKLERICATNATKLYIYLMSEEAIKKKKDLLTQKSVIFLLTKTVHKDLYILDTNETPK